MVFIAIVVLIYKRKEYPKALKWTVCAFVMGMGISAPLWVPFLQEQATESIAEHEWQSINAELKKGAFNEAARLLDKYDVRGYAPVGPQYYLEKLSYQNEMSEAEQQFATYLFEHCKASLTRPMVFPSNNILERAVQYGRVRLIQAWLDADQSKCSEETETKTGFVTKSLFDLMSEYKKARDVERSDWEGQQAKSVVTLAKGLPQCNASQTDIQASSREQTCPDFLTVAFMKDNVPAYKALSQAVPSTKFQTAPLITYAMAGDFVQAASEARKNPDLLHEKLAHFIANTQFEVVQAMLTASPLREDQWFTDTGSKSDFSDVLQAASEKDRGQRQWRYLHLLLNQFPRRLRDLDLSDLKYYAGDSDALYGTPAWDDYRAAKVDVLRKLKSAGIVCDDLYSTLEKGSVNMGNGQMLADVGCTITSPSL